MAHDLLRNYLGNRTQRVAIAGSVSDESVLTIGIPQGTVLGPLLFLVYMNDMAKINNFRGHLISYADDTAIVFTEATWESTKSLAESQLQKIYAWLHHNKLTLNTKKSKFVTFSPTIVDQPIDFTLKLHSPNCSLNNCVCPSIDRVSSIKYLGVIIDQHIRWSEHIAHVNKRLRPLIPRLFVLREILSKKQLMTIYSSLALSILGYCITAWGELFRRPLLPYSQPKIRY